MTSHAMRILHFHASNVKKLRVVDITPKGSVIEIAGRNGQGKTSVLDAIKWAIAGGRSIQWKPIREGEETAVIRLDLGDDNGLAFRLTRRFTRKGDDDFTTTLVIEDAEGNKPKGPQALADSFFGSLSIDPLEFARADPAERVALVEKLVPNFDFEKARRDRARIYDERLIAGREKVRLKGVADTFQIDPMLPKVITNTKTITDEIELASRVTRDNARERAEREATRVHIGRLSADAGDKDKRIKLLEAEIEALRGDAAALRKEARSLVMKLEDLPEIPADPDIAPLRAKLDETIEQNRQIERQIEGQHAHEASKRADQLWDDLDAQITEIDKSIRAAVERANLPVRGLRFGPTDVELDGVPFDQASDAQQLRASLAIAMAMKPALRAIRIRDGSLLDDDAMDVLRSVAEATGFQVWIERVKADDEATAVILEDGAVVSAN